MLQLHEGWRDVWVLQPWKENQSCQATVRKKKFPSLDGVDDVDHQPTIDQTVEIVLKQLQSTRFFELVGPLRLH